MVLNGTTRFCPTDEPSRVRVAEHIRAPLSHSLAFSLSPISSLFGRSRAGMAQLSSAQRFQFLLVSNFYGWEYDSFTDVHHPKITVP